MSFSIFNYKADRWPVLIFCMYSLVDFLIYWYVDSYWFVVLWMLLGIVPKGMICSFNHHHQHVLTFKYAFFNRLLEIPYAFHTGLISNAWVLHHSLGHHKNYLNQKLDESRWMRKDGSMMGEIEYTIDVAITAYPRAFQVGLKYKKYLPTFIGMGFVIVALLGLLFYHNAYNALFIYLLPMIISVHMTTWATYVHHAGLPTDNHFVACTNTVDKWYNFLTGNLGYHTAHHYLPSRHWSELPELHKQIAHKIPLNCYIRSGFPYNACHAIERVISPKTAVKYTEDLTGEELLYPELSQPHS